MQYCKIASAALSLLLMSCASAPPADPQAMVCPQLPPLAPKSGDAQEPSYTETMQSFLRGSLIEPSSPGTSATPAMPSTSAPRRP